MNIMIYSTERWTDISGLANHSNVRNPCEFLILTNDK